MFVNLVQRDTMGLAEQGQMPDWSWGHRAGVGESVLEDLVVQDLLPTPTPTLPLSKLEVAANPKSGARHPGPSSGGTTLAFSELCDFYPLTYKATYLSHTQLQMAVQSVMHLHTGSTQG